MRTEKTALMKAVDYLARQDHSTAKLREKLLRLGYDGAEVAQAIEKLTAKGYLNDPEVCGRRFRYLYEENRLSVRRICRKLYERGFSETDIDACIPAETESRERRVARRLLEQKYRHTKNESDNNKMMAFLYRQGFDGDICHTVTEDFLQAKEEELT